MKISNSDQALATRSNNRRLTISALADEIRSAFEDFKAGADEVVTLALSLENRRIRLGALLLDAKDVVGHGKFTDLVEKSLPFSVRQAQRFMKHAAAAECSELKSLDQLADYNRVLIAWGLREAPDGHGPQTLHGPANYFVASVKHLGTARRSLDELIEARPLDEWNEAERDQLREQLRPVVDLYQRLS